MRQCYPLLKFFVFIVFIVFICACKESHHPEHSAEQAQNTPVSKQILTMDSFSVSPETDSCSCFFSTDSIAYQQQQYRFAYDLETTAYMKINGVMTKFNQIEYGVSGDNSVTIFQSDLYKMYLELKDVQEKGKETTLQSGSIRVMDNQGNMALTPFYGECGCKNPAR